MKMNRWIYAAVGVVILLFAGLVYAWSVLSIPISSYFTEWTSAQLSLTFTICMVFFCLGSLIAGVLAGKINVKINMIISAVLFFGGFTIAGNMSSLIHLYFGYGVMAGLGAGFAYNTTMGTVTKYFPDKPGLISGILLMGFGMGSLLIGKIYQALTGPGEAFRTSFKVFGLILCIIMLISSLFIKKPQVDEIEKYLKNVNEPEDGTGQNNVGLQLNAAEMVKRTSFWLYFIWAILLSAAGLSLISQAGAVVREVNPTASSQLISTMVGLISLFNGAGRVVFGGIFDKAGRLKTMLLIDGVFFGGTLFLILTIVTGNFVLLIVGFVVAGFGYGGITPTNSAFVGAFYGKKNYAVNFSVVNLNLLIASFGSTISGMLYDSSGSYFTTCIFMAALVVFGSICGTLISKA